MSASAIQQLEARLRASDPANAHEQRELFERIRELRSAFDGPLDPESQRCLEAAGMLVAYLARMGTLAGEDVRAIALRLLGNAAEAEGAAAGVPAIAPVAVVPRLAIHKIPSSSSGFALPSGAASPMEERTATELIGDMLLGQILLHRGQILEEHIHQAMKMQRATRMRIGDIFVKIGACSHPQVADALSHQASLRRVRQSIVGTTAPKIEQAGTRGTGLKMVGEAMLGEILVERNLVTRRQLERALEFQKQSGARIGEALVKLGATTLEQIEQALRIQGRERRFGLESSDGPLRGTGDGKR